MSLLGGSASGQRAPGAQRGSSKREGPPRGHRLPLVGRDVPLAALVRRLEAASEGTGSAVSVVGEGGIGKTRLVTELEAEARRRGFAVAVGHAYAVEAGSPYAVLADAFVPFLRTMDRAALTVAARGVEGELQRILPGLSLEGAARPDRGEPDERTRLRWHFAQFVGRLARKTPLLVLLENMHWADASSLEVVHFLARQLDDVRVLVVLTYNDALAEDTTAVRKVERSLLSHGVATRVQLLPLDVNQVRELIAREFEVPADDVRDFARRLHGRTLGNPFFVEEMLKSLIERGFLRREGDSWQGWETDTLSLPVSIRDVLLARLEGLSPVARRLADLAAVAGTRIKYRLLQLASSSSTTELADSLDELETRRILVEEAAGSEPAYAFTHPLVQSTIYDALSAARTSVHHALIADALEKMYGDDALAHANELAPHLLRAAGARDDGRVVRYLAAAGRDALDRYANQEAAELLGNALAVADRLSAAERAALEIGPLVEALARARQRNGEYDAARTLWLRARAMAESSGDDVATARAERRLGLAALWTGRAEQALLHFDEAELLARRCGHDEILVRVREARGIALQSLGQSEEGRRAVLEILPVAESLGDPALLARVHRALLLLYLWTGPSDEARRHGAESLAFAKASGDHAVAWSAHRAMAMLAGLTGDGAGVDAHRVEAERLAHELNSPVLQAWTAEIGIEYAAGVGQWNEGIALAERTIATARVVAPRTLLPRLLVWTGLILLQRDESDRAKAYIDEAWELAKGESARPGIDAHNVIPAHMGMAGYALAKGDFRAAIRWGQKGLAIAERFGYVVWSIHRLLPIVGEAAFFLGDYELAAEVAARLREQSTFLGHRLGLALANAADALVLRLRDNDPRAARRILEAAVELESVPYVFHAARLRRNAAQLLAADGQRDEAIRELRRAHDVFAQLGAELELRGTRDHLRALGARPPHRTKVPGGGLTGRELEIARLVARRKTNKEIARALDISARTVSTHLSNIFLKLNVDSRGALADAVRDMGDEFGS